LSVAEQALVIALMQSDRGLVENVEDADQARSDLGREPDALALAAGKAARGAVESEVVEADVGEEAEALANLLQNEPRDLGFLRAQLRDSRKTLPPA
jgi:hypothetical protein